MEQRTAHGSAVGYGDWSLVPPGSEDFALYGGVGVVGRARDWATEGQYLLYDGPAQGCVHGLYRMDTCGFAACKTVGLDHTQIWVHHDARSAFLLTHPYAEEIPDRLRVYAEMHGLDVTTDCTDSWYDPATLPIRLTIPPGWPLWPIERDAAVLLHVSPISWATEP